MPRRKLPARLRLRHREGREPRWVIVDGRTEIDTGCGPGDHKGAQERLGEHIAATREIDTSTRNPAQISCANVIALYLKTKPAPPACYHGGPLLEFFGLKTLRDVNGALCRDYAATRGQTVKPATVRRELGTLQAAINHWHVESPLDAVPKVWKPEEGARRERVLTRQEAAQLLRAARRLRLPHVARFILLALYTGTRHATVLALRWHPSPDAGWLDWERGIIYRAGSAEKQTRKRRTAARMPDRLLAHVRRWARLDLAQGPQMAVVRYKGRPITRQQRGWDAVVKAAGLGSDVTPHVLKHSAATWLLQAGVDLWDVAGLTSTSTKTLEFVYGHHSPEYQNASATAFRRAIAGNRGRK
jgi:integrase